MDDLYKTLSIKLFDIMEHIGASDEVRQLHQYMAIHEEITMTMESYMEDIYSSTYIFGSFMEGSTTPGLNSDIDYLSCYEDIYVHENIDETQSGVSMLLVKDNHTRPGYVKLQKQIDNVPQTMYNCDLSDINDTDLASRICYKHMFSKTAHEHNGPASTFLRETNYVDVVTSFRCRSIPSFADNWTRQIPDYNWPSSDMFESMASSGCFVVGVGHPASDEKHVEWRLSFSLQERDMMLSFNPTQHKCYILLKMIKNDVITRTIGKSISSYHMKTCMFYLIQNTKSEIWVPGNLFLCLIMCLHVLLKWVTCGYCPNYFIKEENMFDRDVHRKVKQPLSNLLERLIHAGPRILLCIWCDNLNQYLINPACLPNSLNSVESHRTRLLVPSFLSEMDFRISVLAGCIKNKTGTFSCTFLNKQLQSLQSASIEKRKPEHLSSRILLKMESYIHFQLGCSLLSLTFDTRESDVIQGLFKEAVTHLRQTTACDMSSSQLMYASFLYRFGQYDKCIRLLERMDVEMRHTAISSCSCHCVYYEGEPSSVYIEGEPSIFPASYINTVTCVIFLPSNKEIPPAPLILEMYRSIDTPPGTRDEDTDFWFDCAAVDGKVYLHFLKYLVYTELDQHVHKQVAVGNILRLIDNDPYLAHRETAYNLLGWIHIQDTRIREGVRYFIESWKIRPVHNAAKWHLRSLVWRLANA